MAASHLVFWLFTFCIPQLSQAGETANLTSEWGGHIRAIGTLSYPDDQSIYQFTDTGTFCDRQTELRLKHQFFAEPHWSFETHYELVDLRGDTMKNNNRLRKRLPTAVADQWMGGEPISDDRRLMNLTRTISDGDDYVVYHRLDRFNLTYASDWGTIRMGRQALTWGNGMLFNPMDIFNPFAPTTVQRDYKVGEDMLHFQRSTNDREGQLLYLPRRDAETGDVENNQSSFAGKCHIPIGTMEVDTAAALHFSDVVLGIGASGYWGGAAWRSDIIYTRLDDDSIHNGYWQWVANMDYAWQWGEKNVYGLLEFYYNGLGRDRDYVRALSDPAILQRFERGELFTLGRTYLAGKLQLELHPLLVTHITTICNTADPSGIFQPLLMWDVAPNFQLIMGANFNWGGDDTEFGGFDTAVGTSTVKVVSTDSRYLWLTYFF